MVLGVTLDNPGDLTVTGPNSFLYDGQTGVVTTNGLNYAEFGTPSAGASALLEYLGNNIGTNDTTSITTPAELASYFLNGSYGALTPTANNPNGGNWLTEFENVTGLGANSQLTSVPMTTIAQGVQAAEGTGALGSLFGTVGSTGAAGATGAPAAPGFLQQLWDSFIGGGTSAVTSAVTGGFGAVFNAGAGGASAVQAAGAGGATTVMNAGTASAQALTTGLGRGALIILGLALIIVALIVLASENKTVQEVVSTTARAAVAA